MLGLEGALPQEEAQVTLEEGVELVVALNAQGARLKDAVRQVSDITGLKRNELYQAALGAQSE